MKTDENQNITADGRATLKGLARGTQILFLISLGLTLLSLMPSRAQSLNDALDDTLTWSTGGYNPWYGQTGYTHDGVDAAMSGYLVDYQSSWIETTVTGPGTIWFWWKVSSETNYDFLTFIVDGVTNTAISGEVDWQQYTNHVSTGSHTFRWCYSKDKAYSTGADHGWLDQVAFITPAAVIVTQPQGCHLRQGSTIPVSVEATGDFLTYQWRRNGSNEPGATNATLVLSNALASQSGGYDVVVTNIFNAATSTVANIDIYVPLPMPTRSTNVGLVIGWGNNSYGELNAPADLTNAVAVAAGGNYFSVGLRSDGTVTAWGQNYYSYYWGWSWCQECQICLPSGLSNVVAIAAGNHHSLALRGDGTVVAWGSGGNYCETCVPSGLSNVVAIAAGYAHSLALRDDGTIVGWGWNNYGQITTDTNLNDAVAIAAGYYHSLALRRNGTVVAWGASSYGQTNVPSSLCNVAAIAAGESSQDSLALKHDGTVVAWGYHWPNTTNLFSVQDNVSMLAADGYVLALKRDGTITGWGDAWLNVPANSNNIVAIAAGDDHALGIVTIPLVGPSDILAAEGSMTSFTVSPQGPGSFTCQWLFNGMPLSGRTNLTLTLTNITLAQAGSYSVRVYTDQRQAVSRPAKLTVTPRNDSFAQRLTVNSGGGRYLSSTVNASSEVGEPNHANAFGGASIWYQWTSPMNGGVTIDTIGSTFDTVLAVYTGDDFSNLNLVAADDDGANFNHNSKVTFHCSAGVVYLVAVDGFLGATGGVVLNVTPELSISDIHLAGSSTIDLAIYAPSNRSVILEGTTNFQVWVPISTNPAPASGLLQVTSPASGTSLQFYRARLNGQ